MKADEAELAAIARAVGETGAGWLQVIADFDDEIDEEFAMLRRLVAASGRPMTITVLERDSKPLEWRHLLDHIAAANAAGQRMTGQVLGRPTGIMLGFEISQHPFVACPSYQAIAHLPFAQRIAALLQPEMRARILAEVAGRSATSPSSETSQANALPMTSRVRAWDSIFPLGDPPDYEPPAERSLGACACAMGVDPARWPTIRCWNMTATPFCIGRSATTRAAIWIARAR